MRRITGRYIQTTTLGETVKAFIPKALPPNPSLSLTDKINYLLHQCELQLADLRMASHMVRSRDFFNYAFVRKEAVLSSQIEGVQATLTDLLNYEADSGLENVGLQEVCNYLDALNYARTQIVSKSGLPLSLRLIKEMHKRLMRGVRGHGKNPGELRTTQNWIGGTRPSNAHFVPPPPAEMRECLHGLEKYIHEENKISPLIRLGLIHAQFETIHPFLDGNGRLGRLLIALLLESWNIIDSRLIYVSLHFRRERQEYYKQLDSVRANGDWEMWTEFFLHSILVASKEAALTAQELFKLFENDRTTLLNSPKVIIPALRLFEQLPHHPVLTINQAVKMLGTTKPTAAKAVETLVKNGILEETTGAKRNRMYGYKNYLSVLEDVHGYLEHAEDLKDIKVRATERGQGVPLEKFKRRSKRCGG